MTQQTAQAHRINIEASQQSVFEALPTAEGCSRWFTPEVTGDFTDGSQFVCRLNGRSPSRLRVTSVRPGPAIAFEALEGPFAAPADVPAMATAQATTTRQVIPRLTPGCSSGAPAASTPTPSGYQPAAC